MARYTHLLTLPELTVAPYYKSEHQTEPDSKPITLILNLIKDPTL
jgi:hypothetical protein